MFLESSSTGKMLPKAFRSVKGIQGMSHKESKQKATQIRPY